MKNKNIIIPFAFTVLLLNLIVTELFAQDSINHSKIVSFTPQYMINKGLKINIDKKLHNNNWIQISPEVYFANNNSYNGGDNYNELIGAGIALQKKIYVNHSPKFLSSKGIDELGIYLSYGPSYNFFYLNYYNESEENLGEYSVYINKLGGDVLLGYQFIVKEILSFDLYTGLGLRYSIINSKGEESVLFNDDYLGFGYTGNLIHVGLRIGLSL